MIEALFNFCSMGGYGIYIFSAYSCVLAFLFLQWFIPWRRWQTYLKRKASNQLYE